MKRIAILIPIMLVCLLAASQEKKQDKDSFYLMSPVEVKAVRAADLAPFPKTNISKKDIAKINLGQDIPFLLNQTPSVVINSDAGTGIGYTGIRIRGTDAARVNVTLNGIPYNDAESQGTFFVDLPDFSSSASSIQIQRGVGTSSNGSGAFGASLNFSTNEVNTNPYAEINNSYGSFNSWKNTIKAGTGLLKGKFTADLRLSRISSDGFIDRAFSHLRSMHFSTAWIGKKSSLRFNIFLGKEKTYQAWYGISETDLKAGNRSINYAGTEKPGEPYDNETDNYWQNHYQLFFTQSISKNLSFNTALFYTKGKGYYEQYKADQPYADYGLIGMMPNSDFIRRLWLNNDFYGQIFSFQYKNNKMVSVLGGGYTRYTGEHYGELTWASNGLPTPNYRWYDLNALKTDLNFYLKEQKELAKNFYGFLDLQYRHVKYDISGFEFNPSLDVNNRFNFFNPKAGITYQKSGWKAFGSIGLANKEPNRDDFEAGNAQQPKPERLYDFEAGIEKNKPNCGWSATLYYMRYKDQLVLTGRINDVGAYTRTNIPKSYRTGIELEGRIRFLPKWNLSGNLAFSRNKVIDFAEYIDDYDNGGQIINHYSSADIVLSPSIIGGFVLSYKPIENLEISLPGKYVSKQYLDNTQHEDRKLHDFYTQDARINWTVKVRRMKEVNLILQVSNLFNTKYEPNGYTYNYFYGGELVVNNYYFPMAGVSFIGAINIRL